MPEVNQEMVREQQRTAWGAAAPSWSNRRKLAEQTNRMITDALLDEAGVAPGQRVLDLASGAGEPAFAIADRVGPAGHVIGLDLTQEMVDAAVEWAEENGITNVEFRRVATELDLGLPAESVDAVTCRFGLMFMPDPTAALKSLNEGVKPGGRIAIATWGPAERCPFLTVPNEILSRHVDMPQPDPGAPGPFALSSAEVLASMFHAAGWEETRSTPMMVYPFEADSPEEYWDIIRRTAGPIISVLTSLPEETQQSIRDDAVVTLRGMMQDGKVRLSGEAWVTGAIKPN